MAQTPLPHHLSGTGHVGSGSSLFLTTLNRLRTSLIPDHGPVNYAEDDRAAVSRTGRALRFLPTLVIAVTALLLVAAIALFVFRAMYSERIYPAVVVGDVNVGGLTTSEAETRLTERANQLEQGTVAFSYNGRSWTPTLTELGARVELEDSLAEAEQLGRGGDASSRLQFTGEILRHDQVVPLRTQINMGVLNSWFDSVDADINNPAINAQLVIEETEVSITPDATGTQVDRKSATTVILNSLSTLEPFNGTLPTEVAHPAITVSDLEQVQDNVQTAIAQPVRIGFENQAWRVDGSTLSAYLTVETVLENGAPRAKLSMDTERLATDLRTQFVPEVNRKPVDAQIAWNDDKGRVVALEPSQTGITLKAGEFAETLAASYLGDHESVSIPVVVTRPTIDDENLAALKIENRIGSGDSNFAGGAEGRDTNIYVASKLMNGTLVPPGGEFSFNQAIGEITYEKGYMDAEVAMGEQVGRDVGGGVCQVSTTIFRAALYAGMPITERHAHTYRLTSYERDNWGPGFDASILQLGSDPSTWADFRFENFTDGWLLIESYTSYPHLYVTIYGQETGREVEVDWWGIDAANATGFTRTIYDADGNEVAVRDFGSDYL